MKINVKENIDAVTRAIMEPLPVSSSAERYSPIMTEERPNTWVQMIQERKLPPMIWPVAAGVTNKAVTKSVPTTWTMLVTTAAVTMANDRLIFLTGIPCI